MGGLRAQLEKPVDRDTIRSVCIELGCSSEAWSLSLPGGVLGKTSVSSDPGADRLKQSVAPLPRPIGVAPKLRTPEAGHPIPQLRAGVLGLLTRLVMLHPEPNRRTSIPGRASLQDRLAGLRLGLAVLLALPACAGAPLDEELELGASAELPVEASADTYVESGRNASRSHGSATTIEVDGSSSGNVQRGFLRFEVAADLRIQRARLSIYVTNPSSRGPEIRSIGDLDWDESSLTWDRQPSVDGPVVATLGAAKRGWLTVELAGTVEPGRALSLALVPRSTDGLGFRSKEEGAKYAPRLLLTLAQSGAPDAGVPIDAGPALVDAGAAIEDSGPSPADAGPAALDAAPAPADAGVTAQDAAPPVDSGATDSSTGGRPDAAPPAPVKAFPTAEGFGAASVGGRGGRVIEVTQLGDSGLGSLRACVEASGPRTCVFRAGGTITLSSPLEARSPFLTIAGQTAPGGGITLRTSPSNGRGLVTVRDTAHDVIVRFIRSRPGEPSSTTGTLDAFTINSNRVILDHVSASWAVDEDMNTWYATAFDITIQWSIISEALNCTVHEKGCHSKGLLIGNDNKRISVLRNLFASNAGRNPELKQGSAAEVINNLIYNWGAQNGGATDVGNWEGSPSDPAFASLTNVIGNYYVAGPDTTTKEVSCTSRIAVGSKLYVAGNFGPSHPRLDGDNAEMTRGCSGFLVGAPALPLSGARITTAEEAKAQVLAQAGAIVPMRDAVDERVLNDVQSGTGALIDRPSDVGGYPVLLFGVAPADQDHDGMPDAWELAHGLNPSDPADGAKLAPSGYTNLEIFLNELAGD